MEPRSDPETTELTNSVSSEVSPVGIVNKEFNQNPAHAKDTIDALL